MQQLKGHLSPKAPQEKRVALPGDSRPEGHEGARHEREGCRQQAPRRQLDLSVCWNVFPLGASSQVPALNRGHGLPRQVGFFLPSYCPQVTAINSPDSLTTRPPDSASDEFSYFQRRYDFQFSPQFGYKSLNFRLTLANTPER